MDALAVAGALVVVERESGAVLQQYPLAGELADPQLRPLQVDENADRPPVLFLDRPHRGDVATHEIVRRVAHVDTENVGASDEQPFDLLLV